MPAPFPDIVGVRVFVAASGVETITFKMEGAVGSRVVPVRKLTIRLVPQMANVSRMSTNPPPTKRSTER